MFKEKEPGKTSQIFQMLQNANTAIPQKDQDYIHEVISHLNQGQIRVCEKQGANWHTHTWIKEAVLCYIQLSQPNVLEGYSQPYRDFIQPKDFTAYNLEQLKIRNLPPSHIRYGSYVGKQSILMPCFINIGAYIGEKTMIDTWVSIGSCAYIGKNSHISAGTGIGGVLEPIQANPTIIEDNCFIGARCEISEGVIVEEGAVIASGTCISQSTRIFDRATGNITYGRIPSNAVVVPGSVPSKDNSHHIYAAIIVKYADASTREKTSTNELLREQ